ncbi:phytoene dehydrogenase-like protein [Bacillus oleivorans]|uniref:Phytoene dehydrogenase-like protein n=1 Tax=Bacillus oleivorans TaxID=1448271 RepID=A0A285CJX2_9BACI|nr:FAD-dependent oxidoreductase [Bacillus oleivorans]SNX67306.1 phytoene dehydrogenase-like protein [Bacillus oleivorans]
MTIVTDQSYDSIIIGGGLAGLVSANYLAQQGKKVAVIEKGKKLGGRAATTFVQQSYLNLGPHALYIKGATYQILKELGIHPAGRKPQLNGKIILEGQTHPFPSSPLALLKSDFLTWKEKLEFIKIFSQLLKAEWSKAGDVSFTDWLNEKRLSRKNRIVLQSLLAISSYCSESDLVSAPYAIRQLQLSIKGGVLYLDGGWETLIESLENLAQKRGVLFIKGEMVKKIKGSFPAFQIELSLGRQVGGKTIINTAPPLELQKIAEQSDKFAFLSKLKPVKGVALDLLLEKDETDRTSFSFDADHFIYFSNHSRAASLSEQYEVVHVFGYGPTASQEQMEEFLDRILPGWRERKVYSRYLTNLAVSNAFPNRTTMRIFEKSSRVVEGLFLAGDWCIDEGILADASASSAKRAAMEAEQWLRGENKSEHRSVI